MNNTIEQKCMFKTSRLEVASWRKLTADPAEKLAFINRLISILSPEVTNSLPEEWGCIKTIEDAEDWIQKRADESNFLAVNLRATKEIIGFIFLYEEITEKSMYDLRLGYLIGNDYWGKGFGSEIIEGLINWCSEFKKIQSLTGGVEPDNIGSIRVLEKNGFSRVKDENTETIFLEYHFNDLNIE